MERKPKNPKGGPGRFEGALNEMTMRICVIFVIWLVTIAVIRKPHWFGSAFRLLSSAARALGI